MLYGLLPSNLLLFEYPHQALSHPSLILKRVRFFLASNINIKENHVEGTLYKLASKTIL